MSSKLLGLLAIIGIWGGSVLLITDNGFGFIPCMIGGWCVGVLVAKAEGLL